MFRYLWKTRHKSSSVCTHPLEGSGAHPSAPGGKTWKKTQEEMKRGGVSSIYSPETTGKANTSIWSISSSGTVKPWRRHIRLHLLQNPFHLQPHSNRETTESWCSPEAAVVMIFETLSCSHTFLTGTFWGFVAKWSDGPSQIQTYDWDLS